MFLKDNIYKSSILFISILFSVNIYAQTTNSENGYQVVYSELEMMLSNSDMLDFKKAVFLTENAYLDNKFDINSLNDAINVFVSMCRGG